MIYKPRMTHRLRWLAACAALLLAAEAQAVRLPGTYSDAQAGTERPLRFRGTADATAGALHGRVRCAGTCPVRGRLQTTCAPGGNATSWECGGTVGACTVSGYFYQVPPKRYLEATYECSGGAVGSFNLGRR